MYLQLPIHADLEKFNQLYQFQGNDATQGKFRIVHPLMLQGTPLYLSTFIVPYSLFFAAYNPDISPIFSPGQLWSQSLPSLPSSLLLDNVGVFVHTPLLANNSTYLHSEQCWRRLYYHACCTSVWFLWTSTTVQQFLQCYRKLERMVLYMLALNTL